jgi:hypothetical protein
MALFGILIYALQQGYGHYYVEGVGYATVQATGVSDLAPEFAMLCFDSTIDSRRLFWSLAARAGIGRAPLSALAQRSLWRGRGQRALAGESAKAARVVGHTQPCGGCSR